VGFEAHELPESESAYISSPSSPACDIQLMVSNARPQDDLTKAYIVEPTQRIRNGIQDSHHITHFFPSRVARTIDILGDEECQPGHTSPRCR
jgi:hypothetical protein